MKKQEFNLFLHLDTLKFLPLFVLPFLFTACSSKYPNSTPHYRCAVDSVITPNWVCNNSQSDEFIYIIGREKYSINNIREAKSAKEDASLKLTKELTSSECVAKGEMYQVKQWRNPKTKELFILYKVDFQR